MYGLYTGSRIGDKIPNYSSRKWPSLVVRTCRDEVRHCSLHIPWSTSSTLWSMYIEQLHISWRLYMPKSSYYLKKSIGISYSTYFFQYLWQKFLNFYKTTKFIVHTFILLRELTSEKAVKTQYTSQCWLAYNSIVQ